MTCQTPRWLGAGSSALVTGGSSGIGAEFARYFESIGLRVIRVGRSPKQDVDFVADLSTGSGVESVLDLVRRDDTIDVVVACAGTSLNEVVPDTALEDELRMLAVNVQAPLEICHVAAAMMKRRGRGLIVTVGSTAGLWSTSTYAASKSWIIAFSRGLAVALKPTSVRVVCVAPGFTRTDFLDKVGICTSTRSTWPWIDARVVVAETMRGVARGQTLVIPTARYRLLTRLAYLLPEVPRGHLVQWIARSAGVESV